jgi:hypothetical protein
MTNIEDSLSHKLSAATRLEVLNLPHLALILAEVWGILPQNFRTAKDLPYPETIEQLARQAYQPVDAIIHRLRKLLLQVQGIERDEARLGELLARCGDDALLLHCGEPINLPPVLQGKHLVNTQGMRFEELAALIESHTLIICVGNRSSLKAFSLAMGLRGQNFAAEKLIYTWLSTSSNGVNDV